MEKNENQEIINVRGKNDKEILEIYKKIAEDSEVQNEIFNMTQNEEISNKMYELYKQRKRVK